MKRKNINKSKSERSIAILLLSALLISLVLSLFVGCSSDADGIDLLSDDLSAYVELSDEDYKNFPVKDVFYEVGEFDVNEKITKLLYSNRGKVLYDGMAYRDKIIGPGDEVSLFYRGYYFDDNGKEISFDGGCNFFGGAKNLGIGSGGFVSGFETGLIGVLPEEYPILEFKTGGTVSEGDVVYLSYSVVSPDRNYSKANERIDLSRDDIDEVYGEGFKDFLLGRGEGNSPLKIGEVIPGQKVVSVKNGSAIYYSMKVTAATTCEKNPITIDVRFPMSYPQSEELAGKWVKFDVFVSFVKYYDTPEYNDDFVLNVLKVAESELSGIEGEGAAEKYKKILLKEAKSEYEESRQKILENAFWDYANKNIKIKELPDSLVNKFYSEYESELRTQHQYYTSYYPDIESFGRAYFKIENPDMTVSQYMKEKAHKAATEKLIFYSIARRENLIPDEDELEKLYSEVVEEYLDMYLKGAYKSDYEKCTTDDARETFKADLREKMLESYGIEYFEELVYYDIVIEEVTKYALLVK